MSSSEHCSQERQYSSVYLSIYHPKSLQSKLKNYEETGKDVDHLVLDMSYSTNLLEIIRIFPNIRELEINCNYTEDLRKNWELPHLRKVNFKKPIPMDLKKLWKIFSNLEDISIGSQDNYEVFTSEFVNRIVGRNAKTLKKLKLLDIPLVASTYRPLWLACQLQELEIIFFDQHSKEKICISEEYRLKAYEKQKYMKIPDRVFYTKEEQLTTFHNLKDVLKSQNQLQYLNLDSAVIDDEMMDIISSNTFLRSLKIMSPEIKFHEISPQSKQFFEKLKSLYLSHVSEASSEGLKLILKSLKDVETLEMHCFWPEVELEPFEGRVFLSNLKELQMHINHKCETILDSLQFSEKLETISAEILNVKKVEEILKTSPNIKFFLLHQGSEEVANFVVTKFVRLEWFEVTLDRFCLETVEHIMNNAANIKRARILLYRDFSQEEQHYLDKELQNHFQEFFFYYKGATVEIHHKSIDFKMKIGYCHFLQDREWYP